MTDARHKHPPHGEFRADLHNLDRFGADIAQSGVEPCPQGYALWIETTQGDISRIVFATHDAAVSHQHLLEAA
jgi:hypothetical protein